VRDDVHILAASFVLLVGSLGCDGQRFERRQPDARYAREAKFSTEVHTPARLKGLYTGEKDALGRPVQVACVTCHGVAEEAPELAADASQLDRVGGPHEGLEFDHGDLGCASCHDAARPERLHLADGRPVPTTDAMQLCAQCHGPQKRDYDHGAHGGMNGYWDLSAGPRDRNHCLDCHDTHRPAYPRYLPVFPPRDRFLAPKHPHRETAPEQEGGEHG